MSGYTKDPYWVDLGNNEYATATIVMNGPHFAAYQAWLRENGLHAFPIPDAIFDGEPLFAIGIRDDATQL